MSATVLQATIMISQIYEKYMCYLNTNPDCRAFTNYYHLRERIVSGWIHENLDEFVKMWETAKYDEVQEFSSRHDFEGPREIQNYIGCASSSSNTPIQNGETRPADLEYFKPSRSSAQWDDDDLAYFKRTQPNDDLKVSRLTAEPHNVTTKFHFDYDILQGGDNFRGDSNRRLWLPTWKPTQGINEQSVRETNQTNMTLSELVFKEDEDDEMPELMEM